MNFDFYFDLLFCCHRLDNYIMLENIITMSLLLYAISFNIFLIVVIKRFTDHLDIKDKHTHVLTYIMTS